MENSVFIFLPKIKLKKYFCCKGIYCASFEEKKEARGFFTGSCQIKPNWIKGNKRNARSLVYALVCIFIFLHQYCVFVQLYLCIVFPLGHARSNPIESKGRRGNREPCFQVASFHRNQTLIGHQWVCKVFGTQNNII